MFKSLTDCYELSNGVKIPCVGFGMWQTPNGEVAVEAAKAALKAGYRHIDTAQGYGNEGSVGQASDGYMIRSYAIENNVTIFTALDTVKVLLDVLEETTLCISTIDA